MKKIAIMTAGGDCAGLNAAIKSVVMAASKNNIVVVGIIDGFIGFVERKYMVLDNKIVENIDREELYLVLQIKNVLFIILVKRKKMNMKIE